jgi:hypothetical protein
MSNPRTLYRRDVIAAGIALLDAAAMSGADAAVDQGVGNMLGRTR